MSQPPHQRQEDQQHPNSNGIAGPPARPRPGPPNQGFPRPPPQGQPGFQGPRPVGPPRIPGQGPGFQPRPNFSPRPIPGQGPFPRPPGQHQLQQPQQQARGPSYPAPGQPQHQMGPGQSVSPMNNSNGIVSPSSEPSDGSAPSVRRRQYPSQPQANYFDQPSTPNQSNSFQSYPTQQGVAPMAQGALFTPGDANPTFTAPIPSQQQQQGYPGQGYPGQQQQQSYPGQQQPPQQQQQGYDPNSLVTPMSNMSFQQSGLVQQPMETVPLLHFQPDMNELDLTPPVPNIPHGVAINPNSAHLICDTGMQRTTVNAFPANPALAKKSALPLGLICTPFKTLNVDESIPVVYEIIRCRACRTYINPFVTIIQTKWKCNVCYLHNDLPQAFDYDLATRQPIDRLQRAELNHAVVDYSAPVEYMVRAPHPPIYFFIIDVSYAAVQNGMVASVSKTILDSLDRIPNPDQRVKVGFMTVDTSLHFYKLNASNPDPQMMVVSDLEEVFIPSPEDLLVNLIEARPVIESLLSKLGLMFKSTSNVGSALGPALLAAQQMMRPCGGKIINFQTVMPTIGSGDLKMREDPKMLGTPKESALLVPSSDFFKNFALDCSRCYIGVDMFLFGAQYMDLATLTSATKFTGGHTYHYPGYNATRTEDLTKLRHELSNFLAHDIGLEAVLRLRCSRGLRADAYYGNFFLRATQLLSLPNVTPDHSYTVELVLDDKLETSTAVMQTALLYTASNGERRIRVMTTVVPVTSSMSDLYQSADQSALVTFIAKKAVDRAVTSKLEDARDALVNKCAQILHTFKTELTSSASGATAHLPISKNLRHYPLLTLAMLKNVSIRAGSTITSDIRSFAINVINLSPPELLLPYLAPKLYALHELGPEVGTIGSDGEIIMPQPLNLRSDSINSQGVYLLDTTHRAMVFVGTRVAQSLLTDLFATQSYGALFGGKLSLPLLDTKLSKQVQTILAQTRTQHRDVYYQETFIVKEDGDPALRLLFLTHLVEDRTNSIESYHQFVAKLKELVNSGNI